MVISKGAKNAAIAGYWPKSGAATGTRMEDESILQGDIKLFNKSTFRACQVGSGNKVEIHLIALLFHGRSGALADQVANAVLAVYIISWESKAQSMQFAQFSLHAL